MNPLRYSLLLLWFVLLNGQRRIFNHVFISNPNQNQSTFECPEEFGYYPHPMDCTQYYVCVFGGPLLESCTGGLMYSHELQTCDWPRNVDCVNNEERIITVTTTTELPVMKFYENKEYQNDFFVRPTPVIVSRGQPRQLINENLSNFVIKKQTVPLINDHIIKSGNDDRQQRVYRGQPSLIGQVQRDRDGLNHINSITVNRNDEPQKEKEDFMEYTSNDQLDEKLRIADQNADKKYLINVIRKKRQILFSSNEPHDRRSYLWTPDSHYHSLITDNTQNKISLKHFLTTQLPLRQSISLPYSLFRNNQNNFHYNANVNHFLSTSTVPTKITQKQEKLLTNLQTIFRQSNNFNNENENYNYPLLTIQNFFHSNLLYNNYKNNNNNKTNEYVPIFQQYPSLNGKQQYQVEPDELSPLKFLNFDNNNNNNNNYNYNYNNYNNYNNNHKYKVRPTPTYLYQTIPKMNTTNHTHYVQSSVYNVHNDNKNNHNYNHNYYHHLNNDHDQHYLHHNLSSLIDHKVLHSKTNSLKNKANNYTLRSSTSASDLNSNRTKFGQNQFKSNYYNNKNYNNNIKNNSQQYDTINYDSYYSIYDDDVELFRDKELEKEYDMKNDNIDTKKITQNVPLKIVPHLTNPVKHLFSTQPNFLSTENYNQKHKDSEHTVKIYDEIESIKNKDLSLMRGNKYLVNGNYLDSILSTIHDSGLKGTTIPTTLTADQASTINSKYLNQPEYVTKVTVPISRSINNDNGIRNQNQMNHEINPTTFSPNQFYLQMISKNNDSTYIKSKNKPYKVKTIKKILTSTKKTKPSATITTTSTTTSTSTVTQQVASKTRLSTKFLSNTYTETNENNYKDNYYEANLSMVTQTDLPIKISEEENLIDFNTYHNPNTTITFISASNDSANKVENQINNSNNSYNKNNANKKITIMMDSMIKRKPIFLKYNNYSVNNNQPLNNYNYSVKNSTKFWTDTKSHSSKCYNQQTHLCNNYKSRRQRPTLRPPSSIVTKNHELVNIYKSMPRRPESIYPTPLPDKTAAKCRKDICLLPDCSCGGKDIPGDLSAEEVPQIVLLTFDDSVNDLNKGLYNDLFNNGRRNPNGCPITATFYVSHEWTDYSQVQNLYADGHEIASHTISHSFGEQFSQKKWFMEVAGQREILAAYGGVNMEDIRGMRAPFLSVGGNKMFKMLYEANFTYDSSMPVYENRPPSYPYTLDYKLFHDCMIPPCPSKSYPGVWEVPMVMWQDLNGGRCSMGDACSNPMNSESVYQMIKKNFERHYTTNRAPFGLFYHAAWFTQQHHKDGFIRFLDEINQLNDVYILTNWQAIQWVREPTPLNKLKNFQPFDCDYRNRPKKCFHPRVCNLWHKSSVRYMRTCQTCPDIYPWTGKTGVKSSRMENDNTIE